MLKVFAVIAIATIYMKFISSFSVGKIALYQRRFEMKASSSSESSIKTLGSIDILRSGLLLQGMTFDIDLVVSLM